MKLIGKGFLIGCAIAAGHIGYIVTEALYIALTKKLNERLAEANSKLHELNEKAATTGDASVDDGK